MVKLMENTYRDANIAIANEFARLADRFGVDVWEAIGLANRHPRVNILRPGPGVGGHCISVDPWFLVQAAPDLTDLILAARRVNDRQPRYVFELVRAAAGGLKGCRIAALGLTYKPDVDDLRESPAIEIVRLLVEAGANVTVYEPYKPETQLAGVRSAGGLVEALQDADLALLLVAHQPLRKIQPAQAAALMRGRVAVDVVNGWEAQAWQQAGFSLYRLGVGRRVTG
jgi:UDP-N-acetyl-D-mannosaminuronic acid dehydrogenase